MITCSWWTLVFDSSQTNPGRVVADLTPRVRREDERRGTVGFGPSTKVHSNESQPRSGPETSGPADQTGRGLRSQWFEKQTRIDAAMAEPEGNEGPKFLTVILLSDGDSPMTGTPFDRSVNLVYREHFELQRTRRPFVTTLVASNGQFVAWAWRWEEAESRSPTSRIRLESPVPKEQSTPSATIPASNQDHGQWSKTPRIESSVQQPRERLVSKKASQRRKPRQAGSNRPVEGWRRLKPRIAPTARLRWY